jgi:hypothetical protein
MSPTALAGLVMRPIQGPLAAWQNEKPARGVGGQALDWLKDFWGRQKRISRRQCDKTNGPQANIHTCQPTEKCLCQAHGRRNLEASLGCRNWI